MTRGRWVALAWAVTMVTGIAGIALTIMNASFAPQSIVSPGYATVGALILARGRNRIGALFLIFGAVSAVTGLLFQGCEALSAASQPAICTEEYLGNALWPTWYLLFGTQLLLFPSGKLPSRRWLPIAIVYFASWGIFIINETLGGTEALGVLSVVGVVSLLAVSTAPLFRRRKASPLERQQLRVLGYAIGMGVGALALMAVLGSWLPALGDALGFLAFVDAAIGIPVAIGIAILRYRLYELDVVINRTFVYGLLTAVLAGTYLGIVVLLQEILTGVAQGSDLAVAGSTLVVGALFRPLRRTIQGVIDRRFNRARYDAAETLDLFTARLRDQVDLDTLTNELVGVVGTTMQPAHASLWLKKVSGG